jgi:adenosylhomocysteine nucleosidase
MEPCAAQWSGFGRMDMPKVAIVAALEREVLPLVRHWRITRREHSGRSFRFFENGEIVLVCGGIGAEAARRATEAAIALYAPGLVYSAGFAGALEAGLKIGEIIAPRRVVNAGDGSSVDIETGEGVLVTFGSVASPEQKAKLADSFGAQAVDMEAAAVAQAAQARGVRFASVKAISDESNFALPAMDNFIAPGGRFRTWKFAMFVLVRPWMYKSVLTLARNSSCASRALCNWLGRMNENLMAAAEAENSSDSAEISNQR